MPKGKTGTALDVACPNCQVQAGYACTVPTDTSRKPVAWFHLTRLNAWEEPTHGGE